MSGAVYKHNYKAFGDWCSGPASWKRTWYGGG
jgi:hypothetical protein